MENSKVYVNKTGRKTANYNPAIWTEFCLNYTPPFNKSEELQLKEKADKLKESIRGMINSTTEVVELINLIDEIQHLGIDYHFLSELDEKLRYLQGKDFESDDLHQVALRFRLIRQHGLYVSPDVFSKFKDEKGNFKETLQEDIKAILSLYNAAHYLLHNEPILEEAIIFAKYVLQKNVNNLKPQSPLAAQVGRALQSPLPRMMQRLETRYYIDEYGKKEDRNETILEFAKLDFTFVQIEHCKEMKALSEWWRDLNLLEKLHYARDRVIECYFWVLGVYFEPCYSHARIITTKVIFLFSVLDDTYDVYATLEECRALTLAIQRWDESAVDLLPAEYLKMLYLALLSTANEIESELEPSEKFRMSYYKDQFRLLVEAYLQEVEWYAEDCTPDVEVRKENSVARSSGYPQLCCISFVGMGEIANKDAFEWVTSIPKAIKAMAEICRFTDDIHAFEREHRVGQVASTFDCYMKQYNATREETTIRFYSWVHEAWKTINEECLKPTAVPWELLERAVNWSKMVQTMYDHCNDGYTKNENLKQFISVLFAEPVSF